MSEKQQAPETPQPPQRQARQPGRENEMRPKPKAEMRDYKAAGKLAGKAAVIDAPVGEGHAVLFAIRPVWRHSSQGSFALALNAITHWNNLQAAPRQAGGRTAQQ